jgi:hypothetical protein
MPDIVPPRTVPAVLLAGAAEIKTDAELPVRGGLHGGERQPETVVLLPVGELDSECAGTIYVMKGTLRAGRKLDDAIRPGIPRARRRSPRGLQFEVPIDPGQGLKLLRQHGRIGTVHDDDARRWLRGDSRDFRRLHSQVVIFNGRKPGIRPLGSRIENQELDRTSPLRGQRLPGKLGDGPRCAVAAGESPLLEVERQLQVLPLTRRERAQGLDGRSRP